MNNIDYVLSNVILNSYSSSVNFKGFCSSDIGWRDESYRKSLLGIISLFANEFQLVSSLNIGVNLEKNAQFYSLDESEISCRNLLLEKGVITNTLDEVSNSFHFSKNVDEKIALSAIRFRISINSAYGHLFFVDMKSDLIIYPHDDCGLGFIFDSSSRAGNEMLTTLKAQAEKHRDIMSFKFWC